MAGLEQEGLAQVPCCDIEGIVADGVDKVLSRCSYMLSVGIVLAGM